MKRLLFTAMASGLLLTGGCYNRIPNQLPSGTGFHAGEYGRGRLDTFSIDGTTMDLSFTYEPTGEVASIILSKGGDQCTYTVMASVTNSLDLENLIDLAGDLHNRRTQPRTIQRIMQAFTPYVERDLRTFGACTESLKERN